MSISVMTLCWKTCLYDGNTLNVLLSMADWAEDDGGDIFPAIETLAAKCRCSTRTTQVALRALEADQVIERIANPKGGRGKVTEYKINLERVQKLQGLHQAEKPDCPHCLAKRKSEEKRAQFRAQRVQVAAGKGANPRIKGAEPRERIDNTHQHPSDNHQHSSADAVESEKIASLGEGAPERFPEFRSTVAKTWPRGFPADNETASRKAWCQVTRRHPADLVIACAALHGGDKTAAQKQRAKDGGTQHMRLPSNWLKDGDWEGYIPRAEEAVAREAQMATALGNVRRALGEGVFAVLRPRMPEASIARLDGMTHTPPATFTVTSAFQKTLLDNHLSALETHLRERPSFTLVQPVRRAS
jgi:hypothetical protein